MKKLLCLALVALMALSMAAIASAEGTTVSIATWDVGTTPYLKAQKDAYEASHPDVTIEYIDLASQDYPTKAAAMLAANDTTDIFMVKEILDLHNWNEAGYVENLNDYIASSNYDLSGFVGMDANYAIDGNQVALPFRSDFWVLFYNKDIFDAAGVEYPTNDMSWEEYKELAIKLTDDRKNQYGHI